MSIPLLDLGAQHAALRDELDAALTGVLDSGCFIGGPQVEAFETEFAAFTGADRCVSLSSGTDALALGLLACDLGPGDEVITSAMSFIATVEAILATGATPVLADCDPATGLLDLEAATAAITPRTVALVPVHLYGQPVDLRAFRRLADQHGLLLVEDACQAHGARRAGIAVGTVGDFAAFSFYPGKNLGGLGDGGALTTSRADLAERVARTRDHGRIDRYVHAEVGATARLDAIQAAVLRVKLPHLSGWNERRREHARAYDAAFDAIGAEHVTQETGSESVFHQYVAFSDQRFALAHGLERRGIATGIHYPVPLHQQPALNGRIRTSGGLEGAEAVAARCLSIPIFPELDEAARGQVIEAYAEAHAESYAEAHAALQPIANGGAK